MKHIKQTAVAGFGPILQKTAGVSSAWSLSRQFRFCLAPAMPDKPVLTVANNDFPVNTSYSS